MPEALVEWATPELRTLDQESSAYLEKAVQSLPETMRIVFQLRDVEELSTEETAAALDVSLEVVKTRLHRARLAIRQKLDDYLR